jgi:membrane protein DedA with SNARE-associated domain
MGAFTHLIVQVLTNLISSYGYLAVFILMTAESALIPIPSEVTMPFAGFLAGQGIMNIWLAILIGAAGNLTGSLLSYWLGFIKGEDWVILAIRKWGKWLLIREEEYLKSRDWYQKYGQGITFASRFLPVVRTFISLPAGIAGMNLPLFTLLTFIGSLFWSGVLAFIGLKLGQNWLVIEPYFRKFQFIIIGLIILAVVLYIYTHLKRIKS